jgi:peptidoglycan/xylan/chitin deacetylase (PgdA/CDA1 family)
VINLPYIKNFVKIGAFKAALNSLYYSGLYKLMAPRWQGVGVIYMLHQIGEPPKSRFAPNNLLTVTPEFLEDTIKQTLDMGLDVVSLDEAHKRLTTGAAGRRFVSFTFDDGYRDNLVHAYPIFKKYQLPFTIYIPSSYPDGAAELWWIALEKVIAQNDQIRCQYDGVETTLVCATVAEKWLTYLKLYWYFRRIDETKMRAMVRDLCDRYDVDMAGISRDLLMNWDEVRTLANDPLVTIGAHNQNHFAVAKLTPDEARQEIEKGIKGLQAKLGTDILHYAFPYGDEASAGPRDFDIAASFGLRTATTTRKGVLFEEHADHLMCLPRVSLNGYYQSLRYNAVYLSGAPFAIFNKFQKLNIV